MLSCGHRAFAILVATVVSSGAAQSPSPSNPPPASHGQSHPQPHTQEAADDAPLEHVADSYQIYSLLMPGEIFSKMESTQNRQWAIAQMTVNAQDINPALAPEAALKPPEHRPHLFREAVGDYDARKFQRSTLSRNFNLDRPYKLLTPAEVEEFKTARATPMSNSSLQSKYAGYPGITYFSRVYFDSEGSAALVYMLDWCGNLCAQSQWIYLEKQNGQWVRRSGPATS